ncbi:DUF2062 domain-containing protein [Rhodocista pekingensis]|uniref:DUF2062 domain-containing protein n=1 Tax=Rhodocista pekingensis TaxID=201185 RepID=A0ABW2KUX9_9PROT
MFKRRHKFTLRQRVRDFLWPRMGWRRALLYLGHRVGRLPGPPHRIAAGFASGAAVSMTPFVGLHFLLGFGLAWLLRGSMLAAAIGTAVGNPWTFPAIWYVSYRIGCDLLGRSPGHDTAEQLTMDFLIANPVQVLLPMSIGGFLMGVFVWGLAYAVAKPLVAMYQQRRLSRRRVPPAATPVADDGAGRSESEDRA